MWSNTWLWGDPKKVKLKETYEISKHTIPCILNIALRACQIYVKIHFSWKLIMGSEKMEPFDELSIGNISDFHLEPSNLHFFQFFKFQSPFISPKKKSSDYRVHGTQNDRLESRVSTQKSVFKNMHRVPRY